MRDVTKMLIGTVAGASLGIAANALAGDAAWLKTVISQVAHPVGQIFLRLIFMLVVPLIFSALVMGVCELEVKQLGRLGFKTLGYTVVMSTIAVVIGLAVVNIIRPGSGISDELREMAKERASVTTLPAPPSQSAADFFIALVPDNIVAAAARGDVLGLIVFALIFGIALSTLGSENALRLKQMISGLNEVTVKCFNGVLKLAPVGVGALLFSATASMGIRVLEQLSAYVGTVILGLGLHMVFAYSAAIALVAKKSPIAFFKASRLAILTAFTTSSSTASLPTSLKVAEEELKLPRHVSRFVLTAGASLNQNGSALFEGVTVIFLAQMFGVDLTWLQQIQVMTVCILGGIGTAGVPAASLPVVAMILAMLRIPPEGLGLILGVDRLLDMCRTVLNVTGDLAAAVVVAKGEVETVPESGVVAVSGGVDGVG
jgi:DAACS family dicarboxylate/amino acid:cation (Na+ or H+) symporter